ncbi:Glutathione S-transferase GST-6.0 [Rhodobacteraceae bacterium SB2]|nr:Glutathione S-transferase GST-6.0 [Rhodobacteraceae bacterium SB2]
MLEEMGLTYEYTYAPPHSELVKQYNPSGKIPILIDRGAVITDSNAIMTYLADKHQKLTAPAGSIERAHQDALSHQIIDEIDAVLWAASRPSLGLKEFDNFSNIKDSFKHEYKRNLDRLEKQIKGSFLMGDNLSLPDFILGHCAGWAHVAKFSTGSEKFGAYVKSLRTRPAYQAAARLDMSDG